MRHWLLRHLANIDISLSRLCLILCADDILLIATSITILEKLLRKCESELWLSTTRKVDVFALALVPEQSVIFLHAYLVYL